MQVLYPRCAGLDVHKDTLVAGVRCVSISAANTSTDRTDPRPSDASSGGFKTSAVTFLSWRMRCRAS